MGCVVGKQGEAGGLRKTGSTFQAHENAVSGDELARACTYTRHSRRASGCSGGAATGGWLCGAGVRKPSRRAEGYFQQAFVAAAAAAVVVVVAPKDLT